MSRLPRLTPKQIIKRLAKEGFIFSRQTGSHIILKCMDSSNPNYGKSIPVPNHPVVERGVLMSIIRQSGLSKTEFIESLD